MILEIFYQKNTKINLIINKNNQKACYSLQNNRKFDLDHYNLLKSKDILLNNRLES